MYKLFFQLQKEKRELLGIKYILWNNGTRYLEPKPEQGSALLSISNYDFSWIIDARRFTILPKNVQNSGAEKMLEVETG